MQNLFERGSAEDGPLYVRWNPDRSPYAIELKLELVSKLLDELRRAEKLAIEVGGVLIGWFPTPLSPTLRVEDVEIIPRGVEDGAIYMLDPGQHDRFSDARWRAKARGRDAVGFFRTHLRPGKLKPSLADRSMLSGEFPESVYSVLLIEGQQPHNGAFFIATDGQLPGEPSVKEFRFDESEFKALPEVAPEISSQPAEKTRKTGSRLRHYATIAALLLIAVTACGLMWMFSRDGGFPHWLGSPDELKLAVTTHNGLLRISWNRNSTNLKKASGATVTIVDGGSRREIPLGIDELRLGAIEYQERTKGVRVTMVVSTPGEASVNETVDWGGGSAK